MKYRLFHKLTIKQAPTILIILNHNILLIKKEIIIKIVAAQPTMLRVSMF